MTPVSVERGVLARPAIEVAPSLLNKLLVAEDGNGVVGGRIVEVEAYDESEPASHSFRGPTPRCEVMFGRAGHLYVYRSYGIHWCTNVVCDVEGRGAAVLIRALEPMFGLDEQRRRRGRRLERELCSGPGKLSQALGLTGDDNGSDLCATAGRVLLLDDGKPPPEEMARGPRIGISKAVERPWRFWVPDHPHVSRLRGRGLL